MDRIKLIKKSIKLKMRNKKAKALRKYNPIKKTPNYTQKDKDGIVIPSNIYDSRTISFDGKGMRMDMSA